MQPKSIAVIIVAAGRGERASADGVDTPKQYRRLLGEPVLSHTVRAFLKFPGIGHILPIIHSDHAGLYAGLRLSDPRVLEPVHGGATRQASVLEGLKALVPKKPDLVLIHDAARPLATVEVIGDVIASLEHSSGCLPALPVTDTIKRSPDGRNVVATEDRSRLFAAQTPQGFRFADILSAHMRAADTDRQFTDDAEIAEWAGLGVTMVAGDRDNIKITHSEDFAAAERILCGDVIMETRIGNGFDVHPFEPGEAVWLGGIEIPHAMKLKGHSDADVALHALTDAIYGALGEGDIGSHFPPSDPQWKGAASRVFLQHAVGLVENRGGRIVNLDVTIVCEAPKIGPHAAAMRHAIATVCGIEESRVAVKATTNERLGFIGREEGMVAMATASIELPRHS